MKKVWIALLLISTVIGMTMPAMANPTIKKVVNNDVDGANQATSRIDQTLQNSGNLVNSNTQVALGGYADSDARANANAQDQSSHDVGNGEEAEENIGGLDTSGAANILSGNAGSVAIGGDGKNGDNTQINAVVQVAVASITTNQDLVQKIMEHETLDLIIDDSAIVEGNSLNDESALAASGDDEVEVDL